MQVNLLTEFTTPLTRVYINDVLTQNAFYRLTTRRKADDASRSAAISPAQPYVKNSLYLKHAEGFIK